MRVTIVEDDQEIAAFLRQGLQETGYLVTVWDNGEDGYLDARYNPCDLIVLDLMLPGMDGLDVARRLRSEGCRTPLLMLTARDTEADTIAGLDAGADDYLTKPFGFGEFLARVRALLRRDAQTRAGVMRVGDLEMDTIAHRVRRADQDISLSQREYALLEFLMHHPGDIIRRETLRERVWGNTEVESNVIDVYIGYLRHKIDVPFDRPLIHTARGAGYVLEAR